MILKIEHYRIHRRIKNNNGEYIMNINYFVKSEYLRFFANLHT